jgi:hypothetical protein
MFLGLRRQGLFSPSIVNALAVATGLATTAFATVAPINIDAQAARILTEIAAAPFGRSRSAWRDAHPTATWREYRGEEWYQGNREPFYAWPEGMWCVLAEDGPLDIQRQAVFYANREVEPLDCRLEQLSFEAGEIGNPGLFDALSKAATLQFGPGTSDRVRRDLPDIRRLRDAETIIEWHRGTFMLYVYRWEGRTGVMVRSHLLANALLETDYIESLRRASDGWDALPDELEAEYPDIADLLRDGGAPSTLDQRTIVDAARVLLSDQRRTPVPEVRARLAVAAQAVVGRLHLPDAEPHPLKRRHLAPLLPFDLLFEYDGHEGAWHYAGGLADAVRRRFPDTTWGQRLEVGHVLSGGESECTNTFEQVVQLGQGWLRTHPTSSYRLAVTAAVAQAYETWWSVSVAPDHDELAAFDRDTAAVGAPAARREAVRWYRRLLVETPAFSPVALTKRRLRHLILGIDTAQRRFHCAIP